jgi:hypothetical protein
MHDHPSDERQSSMKPTLKSLIIGALCLLAGSGPLNAAACDTAWTKGGYKTYRQVESEVRSKLGQVKILRVKLCSQGSDSYFQVVVLNASGTVQNIRVPAR